MKESKINPIPLSSHTLEVSIEFDAHPSKLYSVHLQKYISIYIFIKQVQLYKTVICFFYITR